MSMYALAFVLGVVVPVIVIAWAILVPVSPSRKYEDLPPATPHQPTTFDTYTWDEPSDWR